MVEKSYPIPNWKNEELDILKNWDKYIGSIWANIFLKLDLPLDGRILEIAPGIQEKIGRGLEAIGFKGELYVIEPEESCLNTVVEKYREHIGCKVIPIQKTMEAAIQELPRGLDAIVANHPLDDMILANSLSNDLFLDYFGDRFGTSTDKTRLLWKSLENNPDLIGRIKYELIFSWQKLIDHVGPKLVGISQYKSYYFQSNNILEPDKHALEVLTRLKRIYANFDQQKIIKDLHAPNADIENWMVLLNPQI